MKKKVIVVCATVFLLAPVFMAQAQAHYNSPIFNFIQALFGIKNSNGDDDRGNTASPPKQKNGKPQTIEEIIAQKPVPPVNFEYVVDNKCIAQKKASLREARKQVQCRKILIEKAKREDGCQRHEQRIESTTATRHQREESWRFRREFCSDGWEKDSNNSYIKCRNQSDFINELSCLRLQSIFEDKKIKKIQEQEDKLVQQQEENRDIIRSIREETDAGGYITPFCFQDYKESNSKDGIYTCADRDRKEKLLDKISSEEGLSPEEREKLNELQEESMKRLKERKKEVDKLEAQNDQRDFCNKYRFAC